MEFEQSDQEQVEALQKWWRENWLSLLGGLVLGLGGILGWQYFGEYRDAQAAAASQFYESIKTRLATDDIAQARDELDTLRQAHPKSPYVAQSYLALAQAEAEAGNWSGAETALRAVLDDGDDKALRGLARLRLARAQWAQGDGEAALATLNEAPDNAYTPLYAELRGDIAAAAGDAELAREAYQSVIASNADFIDNSAIQRKLDALN